MTEKTETAFRSELFEFLATAPGVLDAHAKWLQAGGERLLALAMESVRGETFPWDKEQHVQAAFGAFCAGALFMAKVMRTLPTLAANRARLAATFSQTDGQLAPEERAMLKKLYGYSDAELDKLLNPAPPAGRSGRSTKKPGE